MTKKGGFTSRWGLLMAAMGAAIGTGNIWRFPMKVAMFGGGAFLIPWAIFLFIWSIPLLITEFALGKASRKGTIGTFKTFLGRKYVWMGAWMMFVSAAINFYYAVVMGWVFRYLVLSATGDFSGNTRELWTSFLTSPLEVIFFQALAVIAGAWVVYKGVEKGIERVSMILIPALFVILIFTAIWALTLPGALDGFIYIFTPQVDSSGTPYIYRGDVWINALAQSSWSCSAGMGMAITYGAYMKHDEDTNLNPFITGLGNNSASLIAALAVFGTVFALSSNPYDVLTKDATALPFIHLTALFASMPGGQIFALLFFLALAFAALTSLISGYEITIKNMIDAGYDRKKAAIIVALVTFLMGLPSAAIVGYINGEPTAAFLENQDTVWGLGLIISGIFVSFIVWKYGAERFRKELVNTKHSDIYIGKWWSYIMTYLFPLMFTVLIIWYLLDTFNSSPERWWIGGPIGTLLLLLQWSLVIGILIKINNRIADAIS